jgi:hypothetical protein
MKSSYLTIALKYYNSKVQFSLNLSKGFNISFHQNIFFSSSFLPISYEDGIFTICQRCVQHFFFNQRQIPCCSGLRVQKYFHLGHMPQG